MDDFEEALRNIDIFCKALVRKMVDNEDDSNVVLESMEKLLYRKNVDAAQLEPESASPDKHLIPLPQLEDPLIDVFEDDSYVKILMQCRCKDQTITVHPSGDSLQICKKECQTGTDGIEVCTDKCQKLDLPTERLQIEDMSAKCSNNAVFEVNIPKTK